MKLFIHVLYSNRKNTTPPNRQHAHVRLSRETNQSRGQVDAAHSWSGSKTSIVWSSWLNFFNSSKRLSSAPQPQPPRSARFKSFPRSFWSVFLLLAEERLKTTGAMKTVEGKSEAINGELVPGDVGRAVHAGYDNTDEVEPKSSSVYCLAFTRIRPGTFSKFTPRDRLSWHFDWFSALEQITEPSLCHILN